MSLHWRDASAFDRYIEIRVMPQHSIDIFCIRRFFFLHSKEAFAFDVCRCSRKMLMHSKDIWHATFSTAQLFSLAIDRYIEIRVQAKGAMLLEDPPIRNPKKIKISQKICFSDIFLNFFSKFLKKLTSNFWVFLRFLRSLDGRNGFSRSRSIGSTPGIMKIPWFFMGFKKNQRNIKKANFEKIDKLFFHHFSAPRHAFLMILLQNCKKFSRRRF